jgi:hypothetical protein
VYVTHILSRPSDRKRNHVDKKERIDMERKNDRETTPLSAEELGKLSEP